MPVVYQTQLELGHRIGPITWQRTGLRALPLLAVDLAMSLAFGALGLVLGTLRLAFGLAVRLYRLVFVLMRTALLAPFQVLAWIFGRRPAAAMPRPLKPARLAFEDF